MALIALASSAGDASAAGRDVAARAEAAIVEAVRARIGVTAKVDVTVSQIRIVDGASGDLEARPAPGSRLARRLRFTLYDRIAESAGGSVRVGYVVATVRVAMPHARAARPIARGTVLTTDDLVEAEADVGAILIKPFPSVDDLIGAMAARHLRAGELIGGTVVSLPMLVRNRAEVVTHARVGVVVVSGVTTAVESGRLGDVIGLVNPESGQRLKGRIVAPGEVEVIQ